MGPFRCPICHKGISQEQYEASPHAPFCSARCRMVDLAHWLGGDYAVPGEPIANDQDQTESGAEPEG